MDNLKAVTEEVIKERIKERHSDAKRLTKVFAAIEGHDMYASEKKEAILKRVAIHKRMIEKLNGLLYDLTQINSDLEVNQLMDFVIRDRKQMRDHIEKAAVLSTLLYEDYMDYSICNKIISEVDYIKITVRKTIEGEW